MSPQLPVAIVGAGLAGLTAATFLRRHQIPIQVFEASRNLAGLARSVQDPDGYTYDFGAHFITNRLAAAVGCAASCRAMPRYGETVWLNNQQVYSYPTGLLRSPKFLASAIGSRVRHLFSQSEFPSAQEWYIHEYGSQLAQEVAIPLTESWSGVSAVELSAAVGEKFASGMLRSVYLKCMGKWTKRSVAVGYCGTWKESPHVWHVYPDGGIGAVCEKLAKEVQDQIQIESPVEKIYVDNNQVVAVRSLGKDYPVQAVISTAPVPILAKLMDGTNKLDYLKPFRYRPMIFVNLRLDGRNYLPDVVTWIADRCFPFFRLSEIGTGLPWLVPEGRTLITADLNCLPGEATWSQSDEELGQLCITALERLVPNISKRYLGCRVLRVPLAYPIYHKDYDTQRKQFQQSTGIAGLYSIGRNGEFRHLLMEDVYWRTRQKILPLLSINR